MDKTGCIGFVQDNGGYRVLSGRRDTPVGKQKHDTKRRKKGFFGAKRRSRVNPARHATEVRNTNWEFCVCKFPEGDRRGDIRGVEGQKKGLMKQ